MTSILSAAACLVFWPLHQGAAAAAPSRPNVLWITGEDMSASWLGCYGNTRIQTPHFDRLAREGFLYTHCFAHTPVCAPARSGWITGVHPVSSGTVYMRSANPLPQEWIWYPDALRANGYLTANFNKTDYNTSTRRVGDSGDGANPGSGGHYADTWDSYRAECWNDPARRPDQPFFQVDNSAGCHESHLHLPRNTHRGVDPAAMVLAAYHPDIPEVRLDYARYTAGVIAADKALGRVLAALEASGHARDTIVIYTSDHGGVLGRSKRFLYDSGTRAAFIIRIPEPFKHLWPVGQPGARIDRLISFIDMPKTWLAITGSPIPPQMQGRVFLGERADPPRSSVLLARERMDEVPDMQRALRDTRYLYIRNYEPHRPNGQHLAYLWRAPSMKAWEAHHKAGKTDALTGAFFRPKPVEELYDCLEDPDNVRNLAGEPAQAPRLERMRAELRKQQLDLRDCGFVPEGALMHRASTRGTTIHQLVRDPALHDLRAYMDAADLANFATPADLPRLVALLGSADAALRFWGVNGCIRLGQAADTPEARGILQRLILSDLEDRESLEVRADAAFCLLRNGRHREAALHSLACLIAAPGSATSRDRAWAHLRLLGPEGRDIARHLATMETDPATRSALESFLSAVP